MAKDNEQTSNLPMLIRVVTAGDIPEDQVGIIASNFAGKFDIKDYDLEIETDESLIGGFVIYTLGSRYDYSVKGQLERVGSFVKRSRSLDFDIDGESDVVFDKTKIHENSPSLLQ